MTTNEHAISKQRDNAPNTHDHHIGCDTTLSITNSMGGSGEIWQGVVSDSVSDIALRNITERLKSWELEGLYHVTNNRLCLRLTLWRTDFVSWLVEPDYSPLGVFLKSNG